MYQDDRKNTLIVRLNDKDYRYVCDTANNRDITLSEAVRSIIQYYRLQDEKERKNKK